MPIGFQIVVVAESFGTPFRSPMERGKAGRRIGIEQFDRDVGSRHDPPVVSCTYTVDTAALGISMFEPAFVGGVVDGRAGIWSRAVIPGGCRP